MNAMNNLSLRGVPRFAGRRSNPMKNEIATPFGLAMTTLGVKIFNALDGVVETRLRLADELYRDSGNVSLRNIGNSAFLFHLADRLQCLEKLFEFFSLKFCCKDN